MDSAHRLFLGDARDLTFLHDEAVQLVVTSPPYWQIKDYGVAGQIGFGQTYDEYVESLNRVWAECARTLAKGCRICINVGDQFSRATTYGRYKVVSIQSEIIRFVESIGLDYMGTIIWKKVTTTNTTGGASIMGSFPFPRNGMVKVNYEHILLFKKPGTGPKPSAEAKEKSRLTIDEWNSYFTGIWTIPGVRQTGHIAMFPPEIASRLIRMYSFWGETVLDPFVGSGTTMAVAATVGRRSIGVEIDPANACLVERRFEQEGIPAEQLEIVRTSGPEGS